MKFKFRPTLQQIKFEKYKSLSKRLHLKGYTTLHVVKFKKLAKNYSAEDFGVFEKHDGSKKFKLFLNKIKLSFKKALNKVKEKKNKYTKRSRISPWVLFGTLCSALCIAFISGCITIFSLFFGNIGKYTSISIPNLISLSEQEATSYNNDIFNYNVIYKSNPQLPSGTVTDQSPLPNITRKLYGSGKKINLTLTVNSNQETLTVPKLVGESLRDVLILLKSENINVNVTKVYSNSVAFGKIISSSVSEGTVLKEGDTISLFSSLGKQTIYCSVPDLIGLNEYQATQKLHNNNLQVGEISYMASKEPIGTVIAQSISIGSSLKEKSKISFILSGGIYYQE